MYNDDKTGPCTLTSEQANELIQANELERRIKDRRLVYGTSIDGTPIRPDFSTWSIRVVAMCMPSNKAA